MRSCLREVTVRQCFSEVAMLAHFTTGLTEVTVLALFNRSDRAGPV